MLEHIIDHMKTLLKRSFYIIMLLIEPQEKYKFFLKV